MGGGSDIICVDGYVHWQSNWGGGGGACVLIIFHLAPNFLSPILM